MALGRNPWLPGLTWPPDEPGVEPPCTAWVRQLTVARAGRLAV
jgi:hypothetical protein